MFEEEEFEEEDEEFELPYDEFVEDEMIPELEVNIHRSRNNSIFGPVSGIAIVRASYADVDSVMKTLRLKHMFEDLYLLDLYVVSFDDEDTRYEFVFLLKPRSIRK